MENYINFGELVGAFFLKLSRGVDLASLIIWGSPPYKSHCSKGIFEDLQDVLATRKGHMILTKICLKMGLLDAFLSCICKYG